jgi:hypothetical protein
MENTLNNYQPDNRIFWNLFMVVLCCISAIFYTIYSARNSDGFYWYDWSVIGTLSLVIIWMSQDLLRKNNYEDNNT